MSPVEKTEELECIRCGSKFARVLRRGTKPRLCDGCAADNDRVRKARSRGKTPTPLRVSRSELRAPPLALLGGVSPPASGPGARRSLAVDALTELEAAVGRLLLREHTEDAPEYADLFHELVQALGRWLPSIDNKVRD